MSHDPEKPERRRFLKTAAAGLSTCSIPFGIRRAFCRSRLNLGYLPITDATPLLVAHGLGYFAEQGLDVPRPVMVRSWNVLAESFLAGKFDLTHMLFPIPVWMRFRQKYPATVLAWDHTNGSAVTVLKQSGIQGFEDLGGRQVAVPSWYSMHNIILQMGLRAKGLKPVIRPQSGPLKPDEVNLFILPPPEMPPALLGRKIDAFIVAEPFNALAELRLNARIMRFTGDIWKNHPCCVVVSHGHLIETDPDTIQRAVNAIVKAQLWCSQNPDSAARLLSRQGKGYLPVDENVLKRVFTGYHEEAYLSGPKPRAIMHPEWEVPRIGFQPYPYPSATRFIIESMTRTRVEGDVSFLNGIDVARAVEDLVDDRFVRKALAETADSGVFYKDMDSPFSREEIIEID